MTFPELRTWVGGAPEPSARAEATPLHDPNTGAPLAENRSSSLEQVRRAVDAAQSAHEDRRWSSLGVSRRAEYLEAFARGLEERAEQIAHLDALNAGVPISVTRLFAGSNGDTVRAAARRALALGDDTPLEAGDRDVRVHRVPWGPAALIAPWNAPSAMATKKIAYALAAGATAVLKPSPVSPWSAQLVMEAAAEAGLPAGVVSLVLGGGDVGEALVADPRIRAIAMTGSTPTGRAIAAVAAPRFTRLRLELGSNNPALVLADADLTAAARALVSGAMKLSGQWCEAPRRVLVPRFLLDDLVSALRAELATLTIGSSLEEATTLGPVASEGRLLDLLSQRDALVAAGATAVSVGEVPERGWFLAPTLLVGESPEPGGELFGPLLTVSPYDDVDAAIGMANSGQVGLAAYVFTADLDRGHELGALLTAGEVKVNGTSVLDMSPASVQSFFGDSGLGGHGDADVLDFFAGKRIVGTDAPGLPL